YGLLQQSLTETLSNPSVNLSMHGQGIDDASAIIHSNITLELDLAGFRIDLNDSDVSAKRKGVIDRLKESGGRKSGLHTDRQRLGVIGRLSEVKEGHRVSSIVLQCHLAPFHRKIRGVGLQQMRRKFPGLFFELLQRHIDSSSSDSCCPATEGANA